MRALHIFTLGVTAKSFFNGQFKYLHEKGGHKIYLVTTSEKDEEFCDYNHLEYSQIEIPRRIDIFADLKSIGKIIKLIRKEKFDAVFGHTPKGALLAMIASKLAGVKHRVYYRHGLIYTTATGLKRFIFKKIEQTTGLLATRIVNVSPSLGALAIKDHLNKAKKQLVFGHGTCGGIDTKNIFNPDLVKITELEDLKKKYGITEKTFVIGFCGRICKEKGIRELVDAFKMLQGDHPEMHLKLILIGGMDSRDQLPIEYSSLILQDEDIINTGRVNKEELPSYYSLMDIFVLPSYREGFGMSVIEAGAMGVPSLVSISHGCVDSIVENITGYYIDISPQGIKEKLEQVIFNAEIKNIGKNAVRHIQNNFDNSILWPEILNFYNSLM